MGARLVPPELVDILSQRADRRNGMRGLQLYPSRERTCPAAAGNRVYPYPAYSATAGRIPSGMADRTAGSPQERGDFSMDSLWLS